MFGAVPAASAAGAGQGGPRRAHRSGRRGKPMPAWVLHDLRRSFVTHVSERGFARRT